MALEDVCGINLKGAVFNQDDLVLFRSNPDKGLGLLYGKNGSGKTTISKGFSVLSGKEDETIESVKAIDINKSEVILSESEKQAIYVFNEDYIDEKIRINKDATGLRAILVVGKLAEIQEKLDKAEAVFTDAKDKYDRQVENNKKYSDEKNIDSPQYWLNVMNAKLKEPDGWAKRDQFIKDGPRASNVYPNTYELFVDRKPTKSENELRTEWVTRKNDLEEAKSGKNKITTAVDCDIDFSVDEDGYAELLRKHIEQPVLSDREKYLLELQRERGISHIDVIKGNISQQGLSKCPYCLQELTDDYKNELYTSIEKILSKTAEEHINELEKLKLSEYNFTYTELQDFHELETQVELVKNSIQDLNDKIALWNRNIDNKISDVYTSIEIDNIDICETYERYKNALLELNTAITAYNNGITDINPIIDDLTDINNDLTYYELNDAYDKYSAASVQMKADKNELSLKEEALNTAKTDLEKLLQEKQDARIAEKDINEGLKYIFYSDDRLYIEYQNNEYVLMSRGACVSPSKVSVGERNAIALCYFFSSIMNDKKEDDIYSSQYLLVIDDPVSSFDKDNRIGILSYLRREIGKFHKGNIKTKILILSHDLQTTYDIEKIYKEVMGEGIRDVRDDQYYVCELRNNEAESIKLDKHNEYSRLMKETYKYACGANPNFEFSIGNSMRRILEAYGTFNYKKGIALLSTTPEVKAKLNGLSDYFDSLMYRLVLNGESHEMERVNSLDIDDFISNLTPYEKQRTAQEILCFLYLLDSFHVKVHINSDSEPDCGPVIEGWIRALRQPTVSSS